MIYVKKEYEEIGEFAKQVFDVLSAYKIGQNLLEKNKSKNPDLCDINGVISIIGSNFRINIYENDKKFVLIFIDTKSTYGKIEEYLQKLNSMNLRFYEQKKVSSYGGIFSFKVFIEFDEINLETLMHLFGFFNVN